MPHKSRTRRKTQWAPFFWYFGIFPGLLVLWESVNEGLRFLEEECNGPDSEALVTNNKKKMLLAVEIDSDTWNRDYCGTLEHENNLFSIEMLVKRALGLPVDFDLGNIRDNVFFEALIEVFNIFCMNMSAIINLGGLSDFPKEALQCESLADVNKVLLKEIERLTTQEQLIQFLPSDLGNICTGYV